MRAEALREPRVGACADVSRTRLSKAKTPSTPGRVSRREGLHATLRQRAPPPAHSWDLLLCVQSTPSGGHTLLVRKAPPVSCDVCCASASGERLGCSASRTRANSRCHEGRSTRARSMNSPRKCIAQWYVRLSRAETSHRSAPRRSRVRAAADVAAANSGHIGTHHGYSRGKRSTKSTGLAQKHAQKLGRRLLFFHILPSNGLCMYGACRPHLRP